MVAMEEPVFRSILIKSFPTAFPHLHHNESDRQATEVSKMGHVIIG